MAASVTRSGIRGFNLTKKRIFDLVLLCPILLVAAPMMVLAALAIRVLDGKPILFRQLRLGIGGKPFELLKFRTMRCASDAAHREYVGRWIAGQPCAGANDALYKMTSDPRITRLGALVRRFSIDELPQLINVLRGDMSLIGPRPAIPYEVRMYQDVPGLASAAAGHAAGTDRTVAGERAQPAVVRRDGAAGHRLYRALVAGARPCDPGAHAARRYRGGRPLKTPVAAAPESGDRRLWSAFTRSVRRNLQAEIAANLIRVGGLVFLARALEPRDFGLLRMLIVLGAIAGLTSTAGLPEAVIQRKELLVEHESTAWWMTVAAAGVNAAVLCLASSFIQRLMAMVNLGAMIRLMCIPIFVEGTAAVAGARLQRQLKYGALAAADVIAEFGFVACAVVLLYLGFPRFSLPGGLAARATLRGVITWIAAAFVPRGASGLRRARDLWPFRGGRAGRADAGDPVTKRRLRDGWAVARQSRAGLLQHGLGPAALHPRAPLPGGRTGLRCRPSARSRTSRRNWPRIIAR